MAETAEIAVIGAGIVGTAVAYYLAKDGRDVVLIDRGDVASGTSGACDGNIVAQDDEPGFESDLTLESNRLYGELARELDTDFEYAQRGSLLLVESEAQLEFIRDRLRRQKAIGLPVRFLGRAALLSQEPSLAEDLIGASECDVDASVMPIKAALAMARGARKLGARLRLHSEVTAIKVSPRREVEAVVTTEGEVATRTVVNAAGVWSPAIGRMVGVEIPIIPRRGQIVVTEATAAVGGRKMMEAGYMAVARGGSGPPRNDDPYGVAFVFEPTHNGNILLGSSREFAGYDRAATYPVLKAIVRRAVRFIPKLAGLSVIRAYSGLRPYTPDGRPIISGVETVKGFYVAAGHEGAGVGLAPITGKLMSELLCGRRTTVPLTPFAWSRFTGKPCRATNRWREG